MCPCLSSKQKHAICCRFTAGLMVPSVFERNNYCLSVYELCPVFTSHTVGGNAFIKEEEYELAGGGV